MMPLTGSAGFSRSLTGPRSIHHLVSSNASVFSSAMAFHNPTDNELNLEFFQCAFRKKRIHLGSLADQSLLVSILDQCFQDMSIGFQAVRSRIWSENFALLFHLIDGPRQHIFERGKLVHRFLAKPFGFIESLE